jgi:hypothetical protein
MKNFDTRVYSISDFEEWYNNDLLELSPNFQRRPVWSEKAKSYLIDTIIRGKPMPKIAIMQELRGGRQVRTVVDGQQRLRAILDFIQGNVKLSRAHNVELAGRSFEGLPEDKKRAFRQYELGVDLLFDMPYEDILDIFARINTYTVTLNVQEKINAKYLGYFKQLVFRYGYKYVGYYIDGDVLTKAKVTRMAEAELTADLFAALIGGVQSNKTVEQYYKKYEDLEGDLPQVGEEFDKTMSYIGEIYRPQEIAQTNWSRIHLFYTLFTSIAHCLFGLSNIDTELRVKVDSKSIRRLRVCLDDISSRYDAVAAIMDEKKVPLAVKEVPQDYKRFIDYSRRGTTDKAARKARAEFLCEKLRLGMAQDATAS